VNRTRTVERGAANTGVRATRTRARNQIIVEGTIPTGSEEVFVGRYSVENPSRYAAHLFRQALQAAGVVVERGIVPVLTPSPSPTGWERGVGAHGSAPYRSSSPALRERGIIPIAETYSTKTQAIEDPLRSRLAARRSSSVGTRWKTPRATRHTCFGRRCRRRGWWWSGGLCRAAPPPPHPHGGRGG
jgi:hypothetical protein